VSVQATAWVFERSQHGGSKLLVLLSIANNADSEGLARYLSQSLIAAECRMSERAIRYITRKLEASGELAMRKWVNGDSVSHKAKHEYELPGVVRDGFHLRGRHVPSTNQPAKFAGSNRQGLPIASNTSFRQNGGGQPERAIAADKEPKFTKTLNTTPPTPPAFAGGRVLPYQYANPPKPPNRFQFGCQGGIVVEVLVPIGRKLWRNDREAERFSNRIDQVRGAQAETVEEFFRLKGFQVERQKIPLDTGAADNILQHHVAANV
jgi:hypothetical protein